MDRFGFIHEKLDIKILILFILSRLADGIDINVLTELTLCDEGISYFDFVECVAELTASNHLELQDGLYSITEKGLRNGRFTESSVPFSVRRHVEKQTATLAGRQRRNAMVKAEKYPRAGGGFTITLALSDGLGEIIKMELYAATEDQAAAMTEGFAKHAEQVYGQVITMLTDRK